MSLAILDDPDLEIDAPLGPAQRATHHYLRALQRDGGIIYASPVFVAVTPMPVPG